MCTDDHAGERARAEGSQHPASRLYPMAQGFRHPIRERLVERHGQTDIASRGEDRGSRATWKKGYPFTVARAEPTGPVSFIIDLFGRRLKKMRLAAIGLFALSGMVWAAPELNESYTSLKDAVEKKDVPKVKTLAAQTSKEARELRRNPSLPRRVEWRPGRAANNSPRDAANYAEYSLALTAIQASDPAVTIDLTDTLIAQDPKSEQIDMAAPYYLAALGKQGTAKVIAGANKIVAGRPDNEDALFAIASISLSSAPGQALTAANRLVAAAGRNKKPERMGRAIPWPASCTVRRAGMRTPTGVLELHCR